MDSFRKGIEKFPDCQAERLRGDIMLLSTLDKNHLSVLHHTISELLIG
jgi:hypothetical protein